MVLFSWYITISTLILLTVYESFTISFTLIFLYLVSFTVKKKKSPNPVVNIDSIVKMLLQLFSHLLYHGDGKNYTGWK